MEKKKKKVNRRTETPTHAFGFRNGTKKSRKTIFDPEFFFFLQLLKSNRTHVVRKVVGGRKN